jgi:hypothetical protein
VGVVPLLVAVGHALEVKSKRVLYDCAHFLSSVGTLQQSCKRVSFFCEEVVYVFDLDALVDGSRHVPNRFYFLH